MTNIILLYIETFNKIIDKKSAFYVMTSKWILNKINFLSTHGYKEIVFKTFFIFYLFYTYNNTIFNTKNIWTYWIVYR